MKSGRKILFYVTLAIATVILCGELLARFYLGLGTPPLSITHPSIEYMLKPNQDVHRFRNHIVVNQYGMRSQPFATDKPDEELRIMVMGDSVLNGGNLTAHTELATSILQNRLSGENQQVTVGNISSSSWGPGNWLAYAKTYGFFNADIIALVLSSHDYADNPTFAALSKNTHPVEAPVSALVEAIARHSRRFLRQHDVGKKGSQPAITRDNVSEQEVIQGLTALKDLLEMAKDNSRRVLVFQHWEKNEIENGVAKAGYQRIVAVCESLGISPISLEPYFRQSMESGETPYWDYIHPNLRGQQLLADALFENIQAELLR